MSRVFTFPGTAGLVKSSRQPAACGAGSRRGSLIAGRGVEGSGLPGRLALEHHRDVVGGAGLEVDRRDRDQLPALVAERVELGHGVGVEPVILAADVDDLVLPLGHGPLSPGPHRSRPTAIPMTNHGPEPPSCGPAPNYVSQARLVPPAS